jgi:ribosome recycling factor
MNRIMSSIDSHKEAFEKAMQHLRDEVKSLRTGRATPVLVEDISVQAYGTKQQLKTLASISVTDAKTLTVETWDKSILKDVEAAINNSHLGINPINDGNVLRLPLPELTQERRQELVKVLHKKLEEARITIRKIREDIRKEIDNDEKQKNIAEDEKYIQQEALDNLVKEYNDSVKEIGDEKEKEINNI